MILDLVCQVVDNYGDIAVVWRLAQALAQDGPKDLTVRILVDDWNAFRALNPEILPEAESQPLRTPAGTVMALRASALGVLVATLSPADVIVEAFGAPTPAVWLNAFYRAAETRGGVILHLEYLTAEAWSESYHRLPSPLGIPGVQRYFFVPGFRPQTGGLVFTDPATVPVHRGSEDWLMTLFSYEHDFTPFWTELVVFLEDRNQTARVVVFAGRSREGALASWEKVKSVQGDSGRITVVDQPFVDQETYTALLAAGDFHVVRGEESWVQAVLSGRPFLWHAYLQSEGHQIVKVEAFLDVWRPWFEAEGPAAVQVFEQVARQYREFNRRVVNSADAVATEGYRVFWENRELLQRVGRSWADDLRKNAKLSRRMLEFLETVRV